MQLNAVRTLTVRGQSQGLDKVKADLVGVSDAQEKVTQTSETMARTTETTARRQLSAGREFQRLVERNDRLVYLQTQLGKEMSVVNRAFEQGAVDAQRHAQAVQMVETKYRGLVSAEERARAASQGLSAATDQQATSLNRLAAANDNARGSTANIAAQFQDIGVTAAMGMSPLMIALQQGTQLSAVLNTMQNPIKGLGIALMSILNPISLLTIGFIALAAVAIQWFMGSEEQASKATSALEKHSEWLDKLLKGYDAVRDAAQKAADAAARLPEGVVSSDLEKSLTAQESAMRSLGERAEELQEKFAAAVGILKGEDAFRVNNGGEAMLADVIQQVEALRDLGITASSTAEEIDAASVAARELYNSTDDAGVRDFANEMFQLTVELRNTQAVIDSTVVSLSTLKMQDLSNMQSWDAIARDTSLGLSMVERAANAAAWAIANSGGAAAVAAGQYGTATGAANAYANAMFRLGSLIPQVAAAQAQFGQLKQAESDYTAAVRENKAMLDNRSISLDQFAAQQTATNDRYKQAQDAVTGLTDATSQLEQAERQAAIGGMSAQDAAAAQITDRYKGLEKQLADSGAGQEEFARLSSAMNAELNNSATSFVETGGAAAGAAKKLNAAEKDFSSFIGTADKLAEKLFPAEYARKEAAELMALLDQYRDKLDSFQIAGVEKEISNLGTAADQGLRNLEDRAKDTSDALNKTLGSALGSLFDGPMEDMDSFFDKLVSGFAQMGQANLNKFFEGFGSPIAANDNGTPGAGPSGASFWDQIGDVLGMNVKKGAQDGSATGIFAGLKGAQGLSAMAGAGLGGYGIGVQTQNPAMGALGGALSGFMAGGGFTPMGIIGGVIGGIAGFLGGMSAAKKALKEAKQKLDEVRPSIEQFIKSMNGEVISQYAKAMSDAEKSAREYIALAQKAKDTNLVKEIEAALDNLPATLARQYEKDLQASVNSLQGNSYLDDVAGAQELYNSRLKDAAKLGVSADSALVEFELTLQKIAKEGDLTADQMSKLVGMFPQLAGVIQSVVDNVDLGNLQSNVEQARSSLQAAYEKEAAAIRQVSDSLKASIKSLQQFKDGLKFDSGLSPLDPQQRLMSAQADYEKVAKAALGGDPDAIAKLEDVSRQYLEEARGYYASSEAYFRIFGDVNSTLDRALSKAEQQVSVADRQLQSLDRQVAHLIGIQDAVLSVADAVRALAAAQGALDLSRNFGVNADRNRSITEALRGQGIDYQGHFGSGGFDQFRQTLSLDQQRIVDEIVGRYRMGGVVGGYALGGVVGNGLWDQDSVLARYAGGGSIALAGGEFVNRAPSVNQNTLPMLNHINRTGSVPGNDNREVVAALGRIEVRLSSVERTMAHSGMANVDATQENTAEVRRVSKELSVAGTRR